MPCTSPCPFCRVFIHQLPGLALFALKYYPPPQRLANYLPDCSTLRDNSQGFSFFWSVVAPLLFYLCWQLLYFLIVQVGHTACLFVWRTASFTQD